MSSKMWDKNPSTSLIARKTDYFRFVKSIFEPENEKFRKMFLIYTQYYYKSAFGENCDKNIKRKQTKYKDISLKKLINMFDVEFPRLQNDDILEMIEEMHQRVCNQLGLYPCSIKYAKDDMFAVKITMAYDPGKNEIIVSKSSMKYLGGLTFLQSIMHETYHHYQYVNADRFAKGQPYDKAVLTTLALSCNTSGLQKLFSNIQQSHSVYSYFIDPIEAEANFFAMNNINKFISQGYLTTPKNNIHNYSKYKKLYYEMYKEDTFNMMKRVYKKTFSETKQTYQKYKKDEIKDSNFLRNYNRYTDNQLKNLLDRLYKEISNKDIDNLMENYKNNARSYYVEQNQDNEKNKKMLDDLSKRLNKEQMDTNQVL